MPDLRRLLRNQAPPRFAEDLVAAIEPTLRFGTAKCSETTVSRLGGRPNLPAETVWPRWGHWNLAFIAQIDLAAIPEIPGLPLPRTGSLHFFYDGEAAGSRPEDKDSARVFYTVEPLSTLPLRPFPKDDLEFRFPFVGLRPAGLEPTIPHWSDAVVEAMDMTKDELQLYSKVLETWRYERPEPRHRMGGFPDCAQSDPKLDAQLVANGIDMWAMNAHDKGHQKCCDRPR